MGILGDLAARISGAYGGAPGAGGNQLAHSVLQMLNDPSTGGLQGLVQRFHDQGLGSIVSSWVGTGANQAISADQMTHALGATGVQQLAQNSGRPAASVAAELAALLPGLIDKLTPAGTIPQGGALAQGLALLKNSLGATPAAPAAPTTPPSRS
jgi:uncharacterized protein YidB (DUF937 family)